MRSLLLLADMLHRGLLASTDDGATWEDVTEPVGNIYAFYVSPDGYVYVAAQQSIQKRHLDETDWAAVGDGLSNILSITGSGDRIYAGTRDGVFVSTNAGAMWTATAIDAVPQALLADGDRLFATEQGGYVYGLSLAAGVFRSGAQLGEPAVGSSAEDKASPLALRLDAAYPNPFRISATVRYEVTRPGAVQATLHDVLGRQVRVLAKGMQPTGTHTLRVQAGALPAGLYLVRLQTDHGVRTSPVTLLR